MVEFLSTVEAELRFTSQEQLVENTLYFFRTAGVIDNAALVSLADTLLEWWGDNLLPLTSTTTVLREIYIRELQTEGIEYTLAVDPTSGTGGIDGEPLPNNVCLCVSFRTGLQGRSNRGRNYPPGMVRSQQSGNYATNAYAAALAAAYQALPVAVVGDGWTWVVASRYQAGGPRPSGITTNVLTALVVDRALDSMRRRLVGRGN